MTNSFNPLNDKQRIVFNDLIKELTTEQAIWMHGFLEGRLSGINGTAILPVAKSVLAVPQSQLTILYGSETGHSHDVDHAR